MSNRERVEAVIERLAQPHASWTYDEAEALLACVRALVKRQERNDHGIGCSSHRWLGGDEKPCSCGKADADAALEALAASAEEPAK